MIIVIKYCHFYEPQKNTSIEKELHHSWTIIDKATMIIQVGFQ